MRQEYQCQHQWWDAMLWGYISLKFFIWTISKHHTYIYRTREVPNRLHYCAKRWSWWTGWGNLWLPKSWRGRFQSSMREGARGGVSTREWSSEKRGWGMRDMLDPWNVGRYLEGIKIARSKLLTRCGPFVYPPFHYRARDNGTRTGHCSSCFVWNRHDSFQN